MKETLRIPGGSKCDSTIVSLKGDPIFHFRWKVHDDAIIELLGKMKENFKGKDISRKTLTKNSSWNDRK